MRKQIRILLPVLFTLVFNFSFAQKVEIKDVRKKEFKGVRAIINKQTNEAVGYYTFYVNEKVGGGMINFVIAIFDLDLNLVKQTPITITKRSEVDASTFNGEEFFFIFNDMAKKKITYVTVDKKGDIIKQLEIKEDKWREATADAYPSSNGGFYIVKPIKEKKWGYSVERVDRDLNTKWEKRFMPEKGYVVVQAVESGGGRILLIQQVAPALMSKKAKAEVLCLNDADGAELYNYSLFDGTVTCIPTAFLIDKSGSIATSGMYFEGEKADNVNSDGIFFLKLSPEGKKLEYNKTPWEGEMEELLKSGRKGLSISSKPKVFFHEIVQAEGGGYQVIGETFQKSYQMVSSNLKDAITGRYIGYMGGDNNKPVTFEIMDFIIFTFDNTGKMTNVNLIEKEHTKISVYRPYSGLYGLAMARTVNMFGWFDYQFTTKAEGSDEELLVCSNFVKDDAYIGVVRIDPSKPCEIHKMPCMNDVKRNFLLGSKVSPTAGKIGAIKSKPGQLCVYVFDPKEQTIYLYLRELEMTK